MKINNNWRNEVKNNDWIKKRNENENNENWKELNECKKI